MVRIDYQKSSQLVAMLCTKVQCLSIKINRKRKVQYLPIKINRKRNIITPQSLKNQNSYFSQTPIIYSEFSDFLKPLDWCNQVKTHHSSAYRKPSKAKSSSGPGGG